MTTITSMQNERVKWAASLQLKKYRDDENAFLVEGKEPTLKAMYNGWDVLAVFSGAADADFAAVPVDRFFVVTSAILEKITRKTNPQPIVAVFKRRVADHMPDNTGGLVVPVLEEIRDGGNLGTIMRTCHALGLGHLVLVGNCCDPFAPDVVRASMGSFSFVNIISVSQDNFMQWCRQNPKRTLIATDVVKAKDYRTVDYAGALLLMGNEQKGLSAALGDMCRERVKIPMPGGTESLNVAIATTLLLYEAVRP
jgi:TrmH family RNA methyltransferase